MYQELLKASFTEAGALGFVPEVAPSHEVKLEIQSGMAGFIPRQFSVLQRLLTASELRLDAGKKQEFQVLWSCFKQEDAVRADFSQLDALTCATVGWESSSLHYRLDFILPAADYVGVLAPETGTMLFGKAIFYVRPTGYKGSVAA